MGTSQPEGPLEDWIGLQIRVAQERGDFDDLPGAGKPIPDLDRPWTAEGVGALGPSVRAPTSRWRRRRVCGCARSERSCPS